MFYKHRSTIADLSDDLQHVSRIKNLCKACFRNAKKRL